MNNIASVCTYVFCNNDNGEICTLVGKRTSTSPTGANLYTPPMGMVELGENPYDATVRECFEETGIKIGKISGRSTIRFGVSACFRYQNSPRNFVYCKTGRA